MTQETAKRIHDIYNMLLYNEKYRDLSVRFNQSVDDLQEICADFTQEQWTAIDNYRNTLTEFFNAAMAIALNDVP